GLKCRKFPLIKNWVFGERGVKQSIGFDFLLVLFAISFTQSLFLVPKQSSTLNTLSSTLVRQIFIEGLFRTNINEFHYLLNSQFVVPIISFRQHSLVQCLFTKTRFPTNFHSTSS